MKATLSSSFKSIAASKSLALDKKLNGGSARALLNSLYLYHAGSNISNYLRLETDFKANRAELQRYIPKGKYTGVQCFHYSLQYYQLFKP